MKRFLMIIMAITAMASIQAQTPVTDGYLTDGDIVTLSFIANDEHRYLEASNNGVRTMAYPTDQCLWELELTQNGNTGTYTYAFRDLTTNTYLGIKDNGNNNYSLYLRAQQTAFNFTETATQTDHSNATKKYRYGQLYYTVKQIVHNQWYTETVNAFLTGTWINNAPSFAALTWGNDLYIEKWEQKGAGSPTGHFSPSKIEFSYIGDQEGDAETDDDPRNVQFMIEATTESYYQCINRPDEALLGRSTDNVEGGQVQIKNIYWESSKNYNSNLDVSKYVAHQDENRTLMTLSEPTGGQDGVWQFSVTPVGESPMGLKDTLGTLERWIDYADNVIVEYAYGDGKPQTAEMRVVRKAYHEEELPTISFSINPVTYTYAITRETKAFNVTLTHQHGSVIYNVDNQPIKSVYTYEPVHVKLNEFMSHFDPSKDKWERKYRFLHQPTDTPWLKLDTAQFKLGNIYITAEQNTTGAKRSDTIIITLEKTEGEYAHLHKDSFMIPLHQRGKEGGIQFIPNKGHSGDALVDGRQQVHTAERTIYYLPNQEIELRLPESGYSGYMRWYDYNTNGDPYYNENPADSTDWIRSPRAASGNAFSAINTPRDASQASLTAEGRSYGLYAINKADRGVLNEDNTDNPAPILKGWADGAAHTMACDVSAYTDYHIWTSQNGARIDSIKEPTLSYRQLFHLKPASEMADTLAARSARGEYLENYTYQAPAGKQILLSTEYRHSKVRSHESELCYFYRDNGGNVHRIDNRQGNKLKWYVSDKDGQNKTEYRAQYIAAMDYLIVRSEVYTYDEPKIYTLELPANTVGNAKPLLIARFEVEYVDIERQGPTNKTIITLQRINNQYNKLAEINFDNSTDHLPWEQISYGYVYNTAPLSTTEYKRGASQGVFPFYGEYLVTPGVNKDWARESAHGGSGNSLYVDGTMEPGLVASITASGQICSGQTMYCSAWFCNPAPSGWSGEGNPIFRCNIQGKNDNEQEWHDVGVYFVGELLKGTHWQQVVFPIQSEESYYHIRVSIYNFATTNQGNDFMVDDITLFVSQLPIAAYQGEMACRTVEGGETSAAAVLRLDYSNITAGSDGYMYYQIFNETFTRNDTTGFPVVLTGDAAYYHDNEAHDGGHHDHPYGSVAIPATNFDPEVENKNIKEYNRLNPSTPKDTLPLYTSVSVFLDNLVITGAKHGKAYIRTENSGVIKWLLYVAHIVNNTTNANEALTKLYDSHNYVLRMAYSPEELPTAECNLTTPLHATQQTVFRLRNSDGTTVPHSTTNGNNQTAHGGKAEYILANSVGNCPNDRYSLTSTVVNHLSINGAGGSTENVAAATFSDWLIGDPRGDVLSEKAPDESDKAAFAAYQERLQAAIAGFKDMYGYTHDEVTSAIMYDMRRYVTNDPNSPEYNPNHQARTFEQLQPNKFLSPENYEIIKHLCDNGWLQLYDTTVHFYLGSRLDKNSNIIGDTVRYWCFPIAETAKTKVTVNGVLTEVTLKDCNEPHRVSVSANSGNYYMNITPIEFANKTAQQSVQLPTLKVPEGSTEISIPITEIANIQTAGITNGTITRQLNDLTYFNIETGKPYATAPKLEVGNEYVVRLTLTDGTYEYPGGVQSGCRYGYVFLKLQIIPSTLIWAPEEAQFNGWGKDENWKGLVYDQQGNVTDTVEGYVPTSGTNVIIPKLENSLLYPYIVPEHEHNHYPMTIGFEPHHCHNIYFAPGTHLHNQHLLEYDSAYVDMQIQAGFWNMVSAPMKNMVSGDMYIPHTGTWDGGSSLESSNPFKVSEFQGARYTDAAYAFWQGFYNTTVGMRYEGNTDLKNVSSAEFVYSNTLNQSLQAGSGYQIYGLGPGANGNTGELTIRLPKPDDKHYYYTQEGYKSEKYDEVPTTDRNRLAYEPDGDVMTITLTNNEESDNFLFGNPTMAFINMQLFLETNKDVLNTVFHRVEASTWTASTELTMTQDRYLAPMSSVMLETKGKTAQDTISVKLTPEHLTLNNMVNTIAEEPSPMPRRVVAQSSDRSMDSEILTIYAFTTTAAARTILATNPAANDYYQIGEDALFVSTGVESESAVVTPLNMYTVAEQVPMMADVRQGISRIPMAVLAAEGYHTQSMQVAFYLSDNWTRTCYFCDSITGQRIRIMDGLVISVEMPLNHEQRYYIEGPDEYNAGTDPGTGEGTTTSTSQLASGAAHKMWAYAQDRSNIVVSASDVMKSITLYDITGRALATLQPDLLSTQLTMQTTGQAGVYIVAVTFRDNTTAQTQIIVQ